MGAVVAITMAASAGMQAIGSIASAKAQSQAAEFNRSISLQNAEITRQQTAADVVSLRKKQYQQLGAIRAAVGASGVTTEGSPLDVLEASVSEAELDVQRTKYAGELRARGYTNDAALYEMEGKTARISGQLNAASNLLMGAGQYGYYSGTPVRV